MAEIQLLVLPTWEPLQRLFSKPSNSNQNQWSYWFSEKLQVFRYRSKRSVAEILYVPARYMIYAYMEPTAKKLLWPQAQHAGYCVPTDKTSWKLDAQPYITYAKQVFHDQNISFDYVPNFQFPFYQGSNFLTNRSPPRIVPMQNLGKLSIQFSFLDKQTHIFRNKANHTKKYKFSFMDFKLVLEVARLAPAFECALLT